MGHPPFYFAPRNIKCRTKKLWLWKQKALEADGYKKTDWAINIVKNKEQYSTLIYNGYEEGQPPVYMLMMGGNIIKNSNGAFHNGYGFRDQ